jgi:hypothetical protein
MTLTVRSASVTGATTASRSLTHAEMDANWAHVIDSANHSFTQSGSGLTTSWTVATKLQELFVSAADSTAATVAGKIDAAIAAAAGRIVFIPPTMGAGEATTYDVSQPVIDLRAGLVASGEGGKIILNFEDANGFIRFVSIDDQSSPTKVANAAGLFSHRPTGTLPDNSTGEGLHAIGQTRGAIANSPSGYVLSGAEASVTIGSTGGTIPDALALVANANTTASSTTNITNMACIYAQAPTKSGTGTVTNAYGIVAEVPTAGSTRNWSIYAHGKVVVGVGGSGATNSELELNGSDASGQGVYISILRGGTLKAQIGTESAFIGGTSDALYFNKKTSGEIKFGIADATKVQVLSNQLRMETGVVLTVNGTQVVGARNTGFTTATGSANKDASGINVGTITATDGNIRAVAAWLKAIHDALEGHGLIGA